MTDELVTFTDDGFRLSDDEISKKILDDEYPEE